MIKLAGIDYSMTCPSLCVFSGTDFKFGNCKIHYLTNVKKYIGEFNYGRLIGTEYPIHTFQNPMTRYEFIADWAMTKLSSVDNVLLEGYSMGSRGLVFNIAENTAILKYKLWHKGIEVVSAAPTTIKKFAKKGNASKDEMYEAFVYDTGYELTAELDYRSEKISSPVGDIVDSYFACKYGVDLLQQQSAEEEK